MIVTLVRHAAAVDRGTGVPEEHRYLTPAGRRLVRETALTMQKNGIQPVVILTSPLVRAVQTAEIVSEILAFDGPLVVRKELGKKNFQKKILSNLIDHYQIQGDDEIMLVGHDPDFSSVASGLLGIEGIKMKKGAAIRVVVDQGAAPLSGKFAGMACGDRFVTVLDTPETVQ